MPPRRCYYSALSGSLAFLHADTWESKVSHRLFAFYHRRHASILHPPLFSIGDLLGVSPTSAQTRKMAGGASLGSSPPPTIHFIDTSIAILYRLLVSTVLSLSAERPTSVLLFETAGVFTRPQGFPFSPYRPFFKRPLLLKKIPNMSNNCAVMPYKRLLFGGTKCTWIMPLSQVR